MSPELCEPLGLRAKALALSSYPKLLALYIYIVKTLIKKLKKQSSLILLIISYVSSLYENKIRDNITIYLNFKFELRLTPED